MWFALIMIAVVALVVGPLMLILPSPAQKNKERMRAIAYAKGIFFTVRNLPQQAAELEKPAPLSVYFFALPQKRQEDDWLLLRTSYRHEMHFLDDWEWHGVGRPTAVELAILNEYLPQMPSYVRAVSVGAPGVCVYWQEMNNDAVLQQVIALLEVLKNVQLK